MHNCEAYCYCKGDVLSEWASSKKHYTNVCVLDPKWGFGLKYFFLLNQKKAQFAVTAGRGVKNTQMSALWRLWWVGNLFKPNKEAWVRVRLCFPPFGTFYCYGALFCWVSMLYVSDALLHTCQPLYKHNLQHTEQQWKVRCLLKASSLTLSYT